MATASNTPFSQPVAAAISIIGCHALNSFGQAGSDQVLVGHAQLTMRLTVGRLANEVTIVEYSATTQHYTACTAPYNEDIHHTYVAT